MNVLRIALWFISNALGGVVIVLWIIDPARDEGPVLFILALAAVCWIAWYLLSVRRPGDDQLN